jgi:acetyl-CoA acetyltransferase
MGGASAVAAVQCALAVVATGVCRHVLIPLGRNGASGTRIGARVREMPQFRVVGEFEMPVGALAPVQFYAPMARRHMELYGPPVASSVRSPWRPAGTRRFTATPS